MAGMLPTHFAIDSEDKASAVSLSEIFNENTKLHPLTMYGVLPSADFTNQELVAMTRGYKQYLDSKKIKLPPIDELKDNEKTLIDVIKARRSVRDFEDSPMDLSELSTVLGYSYGVIDKVKEPVVGERLKRGAPSGGGIYAAEVYLGVRNVEGVDPGIYHYNVLNHELELLVSGDLTQQLFKICCDQPYAKQAGVVVMISSVLERTKRKYGERGYRYALLDIGHLGQNIYLTCTALELAVMTTCGFFDDLGNDLLNLDGLDESLMYVAFIGNKK